MSDASHCQGLSESIHILPSLPPESEGALCQPASVHSGAEGNKVGFEGSMPQETNTV